MSKCKYPGCDHEDEARPYSRKGIASATEVVHWANLGSKSDSFAWASSEIAATYAIHQLEERWSEDSQFCSMSHKVEPGLCKVCKLVRLEFKKRWDAKAALGNHVHHLAVSWASGEDITTTPELDPYFDDLELFYKRYRPKWLHIERTIHYESGPREYVGTFDALAEITCPVCVKPIDYEHGPDVRFTEPRCTWLLDIKTGDKWMLEWMLQLSAYRWAQHITYWQDGKQVIDVKMPPILHTGVIWLGSGTDEVLVPVETTGETHNQFLRLVDGLNWEKRETKALKALDKEKNSVRV